MRKIQIALISMILILGMAPSIVQADSITYNYNYIISGPGNLPVSLGTLTFTDNGNLVDFTIVLANSSWKIHELGLNFNDALFSDSSNLKLLAGTLAIAENAVKADGYAGMFDIQIPANGSLGSYGTYSGSISWNNGASNLNVSDFNFTDTSGLLYSSLHIGSLEGGQSVWVGGTSAVPEPGTLVLLGFGLVGVAGFRKRLTMLNN